jgi:hypothetical protein
VTKTPTAGDPLLPSARTVALGFGSTVLVLTAVAAGLYFAISRNEIRGCPRSVADVADVGRSVAVEDRITLMVDLYSNNPDYVALIAQSFKPVISTSLVEGASIKLLVDAGKGSALLASPCLDGTKVLTVDSENERRREQELEATAGDLTEHLEHFLQSIKVKRTGSPLRLLQHAAQASTPLLGARSVSTTYIWSDFLSNAPDCLNPDGARATEGALAAIFERCRATKSIVAAATDLHILGVGTTIRSAGFEQWTRALAQRVCDSVALPDRCYVW